MTPIDLSPLRAQFPSLGLEVGGSPAVYLDNPAGTQVPQAVADAVSHYFLNANANTGGAFETSRRTDATILGARQAMADMLGAASPSEIAFGPNMTTLTFSLSRAIGRLLSPGDEVLVTTLDHDANIAPWAALAERGVVVRQADVQVPDCTLDMDDLLGKINARTKVVAVGYASNASGTINALGPIVEAAHAVGAWVFVDAVQYAPHGPIDVQALGCDFLACSAYKFFGPHIGVLWGRPELMEAIPAYKVRPAKDAAPYKFETGTQNHECLAGVSAAVDYIAGVGRRFGGDFAARHAGAAGRRRDILLGLEAMKEYESLLCQQLIGGLQQIEGLRIWGITDPARAHERVPTIACTWEVMDAPETAQYLADNGVFVWSGNYYALALMERLGLQERGGAVRIGISHYNTAAEIDRTLELLDSASRRYS
jgi:cysteine desulfurase family protein (TIGR01976 family)